MSAILPPSDRVWWKQPLDRVEGAWIAIALIWCLIMFFTMPHWRVSERQGVAGEAYQTTPEAYTKKAMEIVDKYTVRTETAHNTPVVAPPPGGDIYLVARLWSWWPIMELQAGKSYRVHLMSMDEVHGFSLQPENINVQVHPGYDHVLTVTPARKGTYSIICNEYCGISHHTMASKLYVR